MKGLKQRLKRPPTHVAPNKDGTWTKQDQRVWQAVAGSQPAKVSVKLTKHPDVDVNKICPNVGYSVVHYAAAKGLDDCLNILLAHRADASSRDITGATPLHAASRYGHKGTTSKLLASRSVNVNLADKNDCTAMHFAAFEGHSDCVRLLADAPDVNLHCRDKDGRTPLMVAAAMGHLDVCQELLDRDANVHDRDSTLGHTALTLASDSGHADVVRLLCDYGARLSMALYDGRSALNLAKDRDRKSVVDALHIAQLTEAANKAPNGPRLSTSSNKSRSDPAYQKKRHSVDSILDKSQIHIDDLVAGTHLSTGSRTPKATRRTKEEKKTSKSNIARVKAAVEAKMKTNSRRGSDASGLSSASTPKQKPKQETMAKASPSSNRLSLYEGDSSHFYDKEMKFYDTSLSNSSLDISSTGSAINNISKSMDSLKPTPEELGAPYETPVTAASSVKVGGTDFSRLTNAESQKQHQKVTMEYERRIRELESKLSRANEVAIATEKLQKNAEEIRTAQITAQKEENEKSRVKIQEDLERMRQTSVGFEKQNKELLRRLGVAQQMVASTEMLKEQLSKSRDEFKDLTQQNESLKQDVERLQSQNEEMKVLVAKEKENESTIITRAKQKVIEAEQRCNQVEQRLSDAEQNHDQVQQKCSELEHKLSEAEDKCNQLEQKCSGVEQQLTEAEQKCTNVKHSCGQAEQKLAEAEQNCGELEEKLAKLTKEKKSFQNQLEKLTETKEQDLEELTRHHNEVSEIMQMLWEANKSEPAEPVDVSDVKAQVQTLVEKLKVEEDLLNNAGSDKKVLEEKLNTSLDDKNKRIKLLEEQLKGAETGLVQKTAENSRLEAELQHTKAQLAQSKTEKKQLEDDLGAELIKKRAELSKLHALKATEADHYARSCDEVKELKKQLNETLSLMESMRSESVDKDVYNADCEKWKTDRESMKWELTEALAKISQIQLQIATKEQEISDLRVERNQSEAKASKFETEATTLKSKCHESDVQVNLLRQKLTDAKHKVEKVTEENENLRKSRQDLTLRLSTKQGAMSEAERKKVDSLRRQLEHLCKHLQESERRYKETIAIYRSHLLAAAKGELDSDVLSALQEVLKLRDMDEERGQGSHL